MIGDCGTGKTTLLYNMILGKEVHSCPTVGFNVEVIKLPKISIHKWEIGGARRLKELTPHYIQDNQILLFLINGSNRSSDDI